ncbi:MAG TPA: response regulator [Treponemataceae bacterium]|nr:response regulator [Treponemataceae bacterium]
MLHDRDTPIPRRRCPLKGAILCVDDEAIILVSLKQELRLRFKDEFVYETALNGGEALAIIDSLVQDGVPLRAIISDWLMPGMKGDELLRAVHRRFPEIKSIIITGHSDLEQLADLQKIGLVRVLQKPWSHEDLIKAVEACVG